MSIQFYQFFKNQRTFLVRFGPEMQAPSDLLIVVSLRGKILNSVVGWVPHDPWLFCYVNIIYLWSTAVIEWLNLFLS